MMSPGAPAATMLIADAPTLLLVRLSAIITSGTETDLREGFASVRDTVPPVWVEEMVLQSYLFAGFPRGLSAAREWRRMSEREAPDIDDGADYSNADLWRKSGITAEAPERIEIGVSIVNLVKSPTSLA